MLWMLWGLEARAEPWESMTVTTGEGVPLLVERKGRAYMRITLQAADPADAIKCTGLNMQARPVTGMLIKTAGVRAQGSQQIGNVAQYQENLAAVSKPEYAMMGACAAGIDALPGAVSIQLGNLGKVNGRILSLTPEDAIKVGTFLAGG